MQNKNIRIKKEVIKTDDFIGGGSFCDNYSNPRSYQLYSEATKNGIHQWGQDNDMPDYLISLFRKSPNHRGIVLRKAQMLGGNGFKKLKQSNKQKQIIYNTDDVDSLEDILRDIAMDVELYGGYALKVIWNEFRTKIQQISYIKFANIRVDKETHEGRSIFRYSNNPCSTNKNEVIYMEFDPTIVNLPLEQRQEINAEQIFWRAFYMPGDEVYPTPGYLAGEDAIELDHLIPRYWLANMKNGFAPSAIMTFPGVFGTEEEMREKSIALHRKFAGSSQAGKTMIFFGPDKDTMPNYEPIAAADNDAKYEAIDKVVVNKLLAMHQINDPELFAITVPGELGGNKDIDASLAMFQSYYIAPKQQQIQRDLNWILEVNALKDEIVIETYKNPKPEVTIVTQDLINIVSNPTLTVEQKRAMLSILGYSEDAINQLVPLVTVTPVTENNPNL